MNCPANCGSKLVIAERLGIEIDYCPDCRGVWLDRGELDKIIEKVESQGAAPRTEGPAIPQRIPTQPMPGYRYDDDDDDYKKRHYGHKKRKSLLGELFDFD